MMRFWKRVQVAIFTISALGMFACSKKGDTPNIVDGSQICKRVNVPHGLHPIKQGELNKILSRSAEWIAESKGGIINLEDPRIVNVCGFDLKYLDLHGANLQFSNLRGVDFRWSNLEGAHLEGADLTGADLRHTNLTKAGFADADLRDVIYEPVSGQTPEISGIAEAADLSQMRWHNTPNGLAELERAFKDGGFRRQEREVTYARMRSQFSMRHPDTLFRYTANYGAEDWGFPSKVEYAFNFVFFDLTCQYGMSPGRSLRIFAISIPIFACIYIVALGRGKGGGIWRVWPEAKARVPPDEGRDKPERLLLGGISLIYTALYFSLLSAFNIGWRDFNIGAWISRIQPRNYALQATGWVRAVAGIQSLLGVYLVALWIITYFGHPFE
ncbi:hypothetical protein CJO78_11520 [Ralstonia solanacearum]|nr:hypothetical protein CJO78_11520 [Ralstonia solanacearum]AXW06373.1 hypothetical protein CJO82_11295 [Ralstonia solanacearum]AXW24117.1 hypothetical protein CJO86_11300 [Ralstonia solanacearum]AXW81051.1 hypothetical protein CJO98_11530 [Ralstonia solanacearum]